jgi:ATP-binding cassette subfamily B protein
MPGPGPRGGVYEKPTGRAKPILLRLWGYLSHDKWLLLLAAVFSVSANLLALLGPKLSGAAIDAIRPGKGAVDFDTVFHYAALMLVFYLISSVLSYALATMMVTLSRKVVRRMRQELYDHLTRLPVRFFDTRAVGDVLSVLSYDIDTINASLSHDLVQMLASVTRTMASRSCCRTGLGFSCKANIPWSV